MSRSVKKTPIGGIAGGSDKKGKRKANRALRTFVKSQLTTLYNYDEFVYDDWNVRNVSNVYNFAKDGKKPYKIIAEFDLQEEIERLKRSMRK